MQVTALGILVAVEHVALLPLPINELRFLDGRGEELTVHSLGGHVREARWKGVTSFDGIAAICQVAGVHPKARYMRRARRLFALEDVRSPRIRVE